MIVDMVEPMDGYLAVLVNSGAATSDRVSAAEVLVRYPGADALDALCRVAEDSDNDRELLEAAGRSAAQMMMARSELLDASYLANFTTTAYNAFEDELGGVSEFPTE